MSLLNILRQRAICRTHLPIQLTPIRHVVSRLSAHVRSPIQPALSFKRLATSDAAAKARTPPMYPSRINIYRSGTPITLFVGFLRLTTLVCFGIGTFVMAPSYLFSPDHSILWVPALILGSAIPMTVAVLATGPMIHSIQLHLPMAARRSKSELQRFAESPPADAVLSLHYMRLAPWPTIREVPFNRLRRIRPTVTGGAANLEYVPEHVQRHEGSLWFWLVQGFWGRYYVKRDQVKDRAAVPGVLNKMWPLIPLKGSKGDPVIRVDQGGGGEGRRVVRMSGRPGVMSGREKVKRRHVVPPPPPPPSKR